jgi:hypothetical protein
LRWKIVETSDPFFVARPTKFIQNDYAKRCHASTGYGVLTYLA